MDFAPYQSEEPSSGRTNVPSYSSSSYAPPSFSGSSSGPLPSTPSPSSPSNPPPLYSSSSSNAYGNNIPDDPANVPVNQYETNLPLRLDWESIIAYAALPPVGSVFLLVFETKNDYIRFHAWQASLLFTPLFILYIVLSFSTVLSWLILALYILLAIYLSYRAFKDSADLVRLELPVIGRLASDWVDSE
ncbi:hypothetical protein V1514DRAFT_327077 [Lipomyces japonicus]|uniref:uncharacterized protein n=1 Tax=Lipomyces japonicus TaxID=56871 RepID=UPI0034CE3751